MKTFSISECYCKKTLLCCSGSLKSQIIKMETSMRCSKC